MKTIYDERYRSLVGALKQVRLKQKLSQLSLASRMGVKHQWLSKIETYEARLDVLHFFLLCNALKVDPARLLRDHL